MTNMVSGPDNTVTGREKKATGWQLPWTEGGRRRLAFGH